MATGFALEAASPAAERQSRDWPPETEQQNYLLARLYVPVARQVQSRQLGDRHLPRRLLCQHRLGQGTPGSKRSKEAVRVLHGDRIFSSIRSWFPPYQFFVTRMPISLGSVRNMLVVSPLSSLLRNVPVIAVSLKTFLSYSMICQPDWLVKISVR